MPRHSSPTSTNPAHDLLNPTKFSRAGIAQKIPSNPQPLRKREEPLLSLKSGGCVSNCVTGGRMLFSHVDNPPERAVLLFADAWFLEDSCAVDAVE